ncbi:MAG: AraC family transcriptional regulator ligand-binding domain-containing protein [Bermanella sp.]
MSVHFSILNELLISFLKAMQACHIDGSKALQACAIDPSEIKGHHARISALKLVRILDYCIEKSGSNDFSVQVAKQFHPGMFGVLGYALTSSETVQSALMRMVKYQRLITNTCHFSVSENPSELVFSLEVLNYQETQRPVLSAALIETLIASIVQLSRSLTDQVLTPKKVLFCHPQPAHDTQYLRDFFQCELAYDQPCNQIVLELQQANIQLLGANALVSQTLENLLNKSLSLVNKDDLNHVISTKICEALAQGAPSQTDIAKQLNMSLRNLQRKLHDQGTSYKIILENTRKKLALDYMQQTHLSLNEISYLVGFSNTSNFNRAFKRWTELTPGEYRKQP